MLWWIRSSDGKLDGAWLGAGRYTLVPGCDFNGNGRTEPAKYDEITHTLSWLDLETGAWTHINMITGVSRVLVQQL
jgi:hypothetical protein